MELMIFPLHFVPSDAKTKVNRGNGKTKKYGKILLFLPPASLISLCDGVNSFLTVNNKKINY
jgi:hypothetical protein